MLLWAGEASIPSLEQKKKKKDIFLPDTVIVRETTEVHFIDSKEPKTVCSIQMWDMGRNTVSVVATNQSNLVEYSMILKEEEWKTFGFEPANDLTIEKRAIACEQVCSSLKIVTSTNNLRLEAASILKKRINTKICGIFVTLDLWDASHGINKAFIVKVTDIETEESYSLRIFGENYQKLSQKTMNNEKSPFFDNILLNIYFEQMDHNKKLVLKLRDPLRLPEQIAAQKRLRQLKLKLKVAGQLHGSNDLNVLAELNKEAQEEEKRKKRKRNIKKKVMMIKRLFIKIIIKMNQISHQRLHLNQPQIERNL